MAEDTYRSGIICSILVVSEPTSIPSTSKSNLVYSLAPTWRWTSIAWEGSAGRPKIDKCSGE